MTKNINTLDIHICKMCLDIIDPLDDGIYIINMPDIYKVIIVENGFNNGMVFPKDHYPTIGSVIDSIFNMIDYQEFIEKDTGVT